MCLTMYMRPYAISRAAEFVGLTVHQLMNNNTAVALNYGVFQRQEFNVTPQVHMCLTTYTNTYAYICTMHTYVLHSSAARQQVLTCYA